ncbi:PREDICTED: probable S-adenosylmethionine-dependent methyltransferase At5g38100 [Prunus mume]|uniref:Probable S-adenosylmethionine-dependent methyltransferase At5g38100 n=1 Tax=Prunus mume TaxID=102107 RepID=A0ABM0PU94_PRUMU|nr:PREDICTED: probable S-adenosylmethionine-dependent methyltransferase At5g38100 [Prunus mume]
MARAEETNDQLCAAYPVRGGDGPSSYAVNSVYQRGAVAAAKEFISKAIEEKLDMEILLSSKTFRIADLGCAVGPNSFFSAENIIEAVQLKYKSQGLNSQTLEFQVFFNDITANDFNKLFRSLPSNRQYYAAGVPGSFYGRLFPDASINLFHSAFAIPWMSQVPKAVMDRNGPAWNKGRIFYSDASDDVVSAYEAQNAEDMERFLHARAQEIVSGGLMVFFIPGRPDGTPHSHTLPNVIYQILGSCLMDLARKGVVDEEKVDSFNIPNYLMSSKELESAVERNGCFSIERRENLDNFFAHDTVYKNPQLLASQIRASLEGLFKQQFGDEILDELFELYGKKLEEQQSMVESGKAVVFLVVLRRTAN